MFFSNLFIISLNIIFISTAINDSKNTEQNETEDEIKGERIIGGSLIDYNGQFPFQVAILLDGNFYCGGSLLKTGLLKNRVIVSSGFCIK
jgi:secreted trypsin-like serine protease